MAWITTKSGKHINTDWFEDEKAKEKQIAENKRQADELNGNIGIGGLHKQNSEVTKGYVNSTLARRINSALRNDQSLNEESKEVVKRLDANMEKTTKDMIVYREVGIDSLVEQMAKVKPETNTFNALKKALVGKSFTDKGYYSSYYEKTNNQYDNTVLETRVRKGTPAILTSNDKEKEVILGRNGVYKILDVNQTDDGFHIIVERREN